MDFSLEEEQEALRDLALRIVGDLATHERLKLIDGDPDRVDRDLWAALARAQLLGVAVPEAQGGSGAGLVELGLVLEAAGRHCAPVPLWETLVLGALPIAQFGSAAQRERFLPAVARGELMLTAALVDVESEDPLAPTVTARRDGAGWRLDGVKMCVPAAHLAGTVLVPARTGEGTLGVFLLDPSGAGVTCERQATTQGSPHGLVRLSGAPVGADGVLGDAAGGRAIVGWMVERALAGLCVLQAGVVERALRMTAEYVSSREQFGKPIGKFQAVAQRAADAYIDVAAIRWTAWQAIWRLAQGLPAAEAVAVAKFWASEGGHRVVCAAQHLHGGIGIDLDYPLQRSYVWAKQIELTLGSATRHLLDIGASMADAPATDDA
ncbi:MAG: acyl-CoA dehydrogenase family protein [Candidatus Binatia bacterium]